MAAVISICKILIKLMLFAIFLPAIIVWLLFRYLHYRAKLVHNMVRAGMPRKYALELAKETRFSRMFIISMKQKNQT